MNDPGSITLAAADLRSPDPKVRDEAARRIWERYSAQLVLLARRRLDLRIQRREGPEDVVQSAFGSFLDGKATLDSREDLWRLLVRITICKVANTAKKHHAARRDVRREQGLAAPGSDIDRDPIVELMDGRTPSPDEVAILEEEIQEWFARIPEKLRQVAQWRLEGYSNREIAGMLQRTERSVELKLQIIRQHLEDRFQALTSPLD